LEYNQFQYVPSTTKFTKIH